MPAAEHNMAEALANAIEMTKHHKEDVGHVTFHVLTDDLHYVSVTVRHIRGPEWKDA